MSQSDTHTLSQMRQETEQTRAALTSTVEELRDTVTDTAVELKNRLRPQAIKAEVSGFIRSRGEQLLHDVTESARRNPMQAIAVGASLAYPAMRMARAIPLPILMIGAGLFLAGSRTGQNLTQKASDLAADVTEKALHSADQLRSQASELGGDVTKTMHDVRDRTVESFDRIAEASGASRLGDISAKAAQQTASQVSEAARTVQDRASEAAHAVQDRASQMGREFVDTTRARLSEAGDNLSAAGRTTVDAVRGSIKENPLLVAGVGLLVGGFIASVLPKSETEESLFESVSKAVKRQAREAASAGLESAKAATGEVLGNVTQQASAEGLTPDGLGEAGRDIGQRLHRVVERGVTAALDSNQQGENREPIQNTGGGRHNG